MAIGESQRALEVSRRLGPDVDPAVAFEHAAQGFELQVAHWGAGGQLSPRIGEHGLQIGHLLGVGRVVGDFQREGGEIALGRAHCRAV